MEKIFQKNFWKRLFLKNLPPKFTSSNKHRNNMNSNDKFTIAFQSASMDFFTHCQTKGLTVEQTKEAAMSEQGQKMIAERIKFYLESI